MLFLLLRFKISPPFEAQRMFKKKWLRINLISACLFGIFLIVFSLVREPRMNRKIPFFEANIHELKPLRPLSNHLDRKEIVFGASVSKTGKYTAEGARVIEGYELWKTRINTHGGLRVGAKAYPVKILYYNDESIEETVRKNITTLIEKDRVDFLLGPFSSELTLAAIEVAEKYGIIMVETCGASETVFANNPRCTFATLTSASWYLKDFFELASQIYPAPKTFALLAMDKNFTKSVAKGARIWAGKYGLSEVYYGIAEKDTENFIPYLEEIREKKPDIIVFSGHYKNSLNFTSQLASMRELFPKAVVMTLGPTQRDYVKEMGQKAEFKIGISQWSSRSGHIGPVFGSSRQYEDLFVSQYGYRPTYQNAQASAGCVIYQLAIEKCQSLEAEQILENIRNLDTEIFYGKIKFDSRGFNIGHKMVVIQIQNGEQKLIWPPESAETDLIFPIPRDSGK